MRELGRKVRKRSQRLRRWSQRDLLQLARTSVSGWLEEVANRQVAVAFAVDKAAKGRVAVLVLGLAPQRNSAPQTEGDGFVASSRKYEEIANYPRIMARLWSRAQEYAVELLAENPPNHRLETDG